MLGRVQLNATDEGIVRTALGESNHNLAATVGCDRELLLDSRLVATCGIDIERTQNRRSIDRDVELTLSSSLPGQLSPIELQCIRLASLQTSQRIRERTIP